MIATEEEISLDMPRYVGTSADQEAEAYCQEIIDHIARFDSDKLHAVLVAIDDIEFEPNEETIAAMEEARSLASDPNAKIYSSYAELEAELLAERCDLRANFGHAACASRWM